MKWIHIIKKLQEYPGASLCF